MPPIEEAKERQGARTDLKPNIPEMLPECKSGQGDARDQAGALMGVSGRYVSDAKAIAEKSPELLEEVRAGTGNHKDPQEIP